MAFNFAAFSYIIALIGDAVLIFFSIFHVSFFFVFVRLYLRKYENTRVDPTGLFANSRALPRMPEFQQFTKK